MAATPGALASLAMAGGLAPLAGRGHPPSRKRCGLLRRFRLPPSLYELRWTQSLVELPRDRPFLAKTVMSIEIVITGLDDPVIHLRKRLLTKMDGCPDHVRA
jgi:hypothetical protein